MNTTEKCGYSRSAQANSLQASGFMAALTGLLVYSFLLTWYMSTLTASNKEMGTWTFLGLASLTLIGSFMSSSNNTGVVLFGFHIIIVPFGLMLGPLVAKYDTEILQRVLTMTASITLVMGGLGIVRPRWFANLGAPLFMALTCLLGLRILQCFVPAMAAMGWVDYLSIGIFSLYIGYDMMRAYNGEWTISAALKSAVNLYLDVLNLFLSLLGTQDNKK